MKVFYFDVETTGLDPKRHDIVSIAYIIEVDGQIRHEETLEVQPFSYDTIEKTALDINGLTVDRIKTFELPIPTHDRIVAYMGKFCDKYDRNDKFYPAGYNIKGFDMLFLAEFFKKCGDNYFGSWFNGKCIDPLPVLHFLEYKGVLSLPNYKLQTVCDYLKIPLVAHNPGSDLHATREILLRLAKKKA